MFVIPEYLEISDHRDDKCEATRKYGTDKFEATRLVCSEQVSETFVRKYKEIQGNITKRKEI